MKTAHIRYISLLMALVMIFTISPVSVFAENRQESASGRYFNPLYAGIEIPHLESKAAEDIAAYSTDPVFHTDWDTAVAEVRNALKARQDIITVGYQTNESPDLDDLVAEIWEDAQVHTGVPNEGDYLTNAWYDVIFDITCEKTGNVSRCTITYLPFYFTTAKQEAELDSAVESLLAELNLSGGTEYEKLKGVYDWICGNVEYDYANLEDPTYTLKHSAYAALIDRSAVCQGYAALLYRLLLELGVDNRVITGDAGEPHAWNIVGLDGKYYNVDATWDAGITVYYRYFLCTENNFPGHTRDSEFCTPEFHAAYPMSETPFVQTVAASGTLDNGMEWVLDGDTGMLTISGKGPMPDFVNQGAPWFPYADSISGVTLTDGITSVGNFSFGRCKNMTTASIPTTVTRIGDMAFNNCRSLLAIELHEGITVIEHSAFGECTALKELTLPSTVTEYGSSAFSHCVSLTSLTFAENTTFIPNAFYNCDSLQYITIPDTVVEIDDTAFRDCSALKEVFLPASVTKMGEAVFSNCGSLTDIHVAEDNPSYSSIDGVLFSKDGKILHCYPAGRYGEYTIPDGTETIYDSSFSGAARLTDIHFPDSVKIIDEYAFSWCHSLTDVVIGEGVEFIGNYGFGQCEGLRSVHLGKNVRELEGAFRFFSMSRSSYLETVYFTGDAPKIDKYTFHKDIEATCYYPAGNKTWTEDVLQDYGGKLTWVPVSSCDGNHTYEATVVPPTCAESGYTEYYCTGCGETYRDNYTDPLEHIFETFVYPPNCMMEGFTEHYCSVCGYAYLDDFTEPVPHDYVTEVYPGNCWEYGYTLYTCSFCGESYLEYFTELAPHIYESYTFPPTCMDGGYTEYWCILCGDWRMDDFTDPVGHNYEAVVTPPTYESEGYTTYTCRDCWDTYVDDYVPALIHHEILEGDGAVWDGGKPISIRISADPENFLEVWVNGEILDPDCYTVSADTTIITLNAEYLATLPIGDYTMEIRFTDGSATAVFHIAQIDVLPGDVNGDGEIDIFDANLIVAYYNGTAELSGDQLKAADVNDDGEADIFDANLVVSYYNGTISEFG